MEFRSPRTPELLHGPLGLEHSSQSKRPEDPVDEGFVEVFGGQVPNQSRLSRGVHNPLMGIGLYAAEHRVPFSKTISQGDLVEVLVGDVVPQLLARDEEAGFDIPISCFVTSMCIRRTGAFLGPVSNLNTSGTLSPQLQHVDPHVLVDLQLRCFLGMDLGKTCPFRTPVWTCPCHPSMDSAGIVDLEVLDEPLDRWLMLHGVPLH